MKRVFQLILLLLVLSFTATAGAADVKTGYITGKLLVKGGGSMAGGTVFLFNDLTGPPPDLDKYWRAPDELAEIDKDGRFTAELAEGKYYLGAIKRVSEKEIGPPQEGDIFFTSRDEKGNAKPYYITIGKKTDIGIIAEAIPFKRERVKLTAGVTAITGTIYDVAGKPMERALVFAFLTPAMVGKPLFVSDRTGKDGQYILRVADGGKYYLKVRSVYGGGPPRTAGVKSPLTEGEAKRGYVEESPIEVTVKKGEVLKGIDVKGVKFPEKPKTE